MGRALPKLDVSLSWPSCSKCPRRHPADRPCPPDGVWLFSRGPVGNAGVVWLLRPMPDGQWPVDQSLPRDDSWSWWVRSACGHTGGARQWAFHEKDDALTYEWIFREDPCRYTHCQDPKRRKDA